MTATVARLPGTVELAPLTVEAVAEYQRRRAAAQRKVAAGEKTVQQATALLLPWLRAAVALGADHLPELREEFDWFADSPVADRNPVERRYACALVADRICPRPAMIAALTLARGAALDNAEGDPTPARQDRARTLDRLARHFGCPPVPPALSPERKAA